jgi:hypothetical protein
MAWYEQLDLDFGSINDQFTDLMGDVRVLCFMINTVIYYLIVNGKYVFTW